MGYIGKVPADVLIDPHVDSASIVDSTIVTADIANDAVTSAKLAQNSVDSSELIDGSVDNSHLAGSIAMNKTLLSAGTGLTLSTNTLSVDAAQSQITSVGTLTGLTVANDMSLSVAGKRYYIPRASDGALTGSLYSSTGNTITLSGAGSSSGIINFIPSASNSSAVTLTLESSGRMVASSVLSTGTDYLDGDASLYLANSGSSGTIIKLGDTNAGLVYGGSGTGTFKIMQRQNTALSFDASRNATFSGLTKTTKLFEAAGGSGGQQAYSSSVTSSYRGGGLMRFFTDNNVSIFKFGNESSPYGGFFGTFAGYSPSGAELMVLGIDGVNLGTNRNSEIIGLRVANDGNVGINETSPYDSNWGSSSKQLTITGSDYAVLRLKDHDSNFAIGAGDGKHYMSYDRTAERHNLIMNSSGLATFGGTVLIDGLSNYTGLEVKGAGGSRPQIKFTNVNNGNLASIFATEGNGININTGTNLDSALVIANTQTPTFYGNSIDQEVESGYGKTVFKTWQVNGSYTGDIKIRCATTSWKCVIYDIVVVCHQGGGHWTGMFYHNTAVTNGYQTTSNYNGAIGNLGVNAISGNNQGVDFDIPLNTSPVGTHFLIQIKLSVGGGDKIGGDALTVSID